MQNLRAQHRLALEILARGSWKAQRPGDTSGHDCDDGVQQKAANLGT